MRLKTWIERLLTGVFFIGSIAAAALWVAALTAKCEGFGCLGVGAMIAMAVALQAATAGIGGLALWMRSRRGAASRILWTMEALHLLPIFWFLMRRLFV